MKNITKALHRALTYTLSISIIWSGLLAAQEGNQLFIPIGVGDITTFIPVLGAPGSISVVEDTQPIGESVYQVSWSAVGNATYYQINVTDENGQITSFTTTDLDYDLSGLPLGTSTVQLLACNSNDQCGAAADLGTYTVNERIRYAYADVLGSPILETDQAGNAIAEFHYKPFGETEEEKQEDIGYTGHLEDTDLALTYMQARYYDPVVGRFYGNDPVGYTSSNPAMSFNRYLYANNNPYKYTDPDGEFLIAGALIGAAFDIGIQAALIASGKQDKFSVGSVLVSAGAGALGVGVAQKIAQAGKLSNLARTGASLSSDAALSAGSTALKGENITATGVASDVLLGQAGGAAIGNLKGSAANSETGKILENAADRAERIANNADVGRPEARARQAQQARSNQQSYVAGADANAGAVGSNLAQGAANVLSPNCSNQDGAGC